MSNPDLDDNSKGLAFPVCIRDLNHTKNRACVGECDWVKLARWSALDLGFASGGCPPELLDRLVSPSQPR